MENIILSPIPLQDLLDHVRQAVREEMATGVKNLQPAKSQDGYLSRAETAKALRITLPTLGIWTKTGVIKAYRIKRRVLYKADEIDMALKEMKVK